MHVLRSGLRACADRAQLAGDFVGEHLAQAGAEQVRGVAAVRSRDDVTAETGRTARAAVAGRTAVAEAGAERGIRHDVAAGVEIDAGADALLLGELALEQLASAAHGARRIARDQV